MEIKLYTTQGCHLCEQALALLLHARDNGYELEISEVEIADSEPLMARYGIRIPVIQPTASDRELGWPFSYEDLERFINNPE